MLELICVTTFLLDTNEKKKGENMNIYMYFLILCLCMQIRVFAICENFLKSFLKEK